MVPLWHSDRPNATSPSPWRSRGRAARLSCLMFTESVTLALSGS